MVASWRLKVALSLSLTVTFLSNAWKTGFLPSLFLRKPLELLSTVIVSANLISLNPIQTQAVGNYNNLFVSNASPELKGSKPQFNKYYFGIGCFWHVQHEFVEKERSLLGRKDDEITTIAGYAGGTKAQKDGLVCYHNIEGITDYSRLGHAEVVTVDFPSENFQDFAALYLSLFSKNLDRPDVGDRGAEYRSVIGLPGGIENENFQMIKQLGEMKGLKFVAGEGNDKDTLGKKMVWVMDSSKLPFYQAEIFHQFHDGFMPGEQYPASYNRLANIAFQRGLIDNTGCPTFRW